MCKLLLNTFNEHELNYHTGNALLTLDIKDKWKINGFNAVIGNPPYTASKQDITGQGGTNLWIDFDQKALNEWLLPDGYLCFIHPPMWRKPYVNETKNSKFYKHMLKQNIIYINHFTDKQTKKLMNANTRVDCYILQKSEYKHKTTFIDYYNNKYEKVDLNNFAFIPNAFLPIFQKIFKKLDNNGIQAIKTTAKDDDAARGKYEYVTNLTNSSFVTKLEPKKHIHQHRSKVLFSDTREPKFMFDKGRYGCGSNIIYIQTDDDYILKYLQTAFFKFVIKHTKYSTFQTDWELFHFIPDIKIYNKRLFKENDIYDYYGFTKDEIALIENNA